MSAWVDNGGQTGLDAIVAALGSVGTDGDAGSFSAVAQDCSQLSTAIAGIQAVGPIPDPKAERPFAKALSLYGEAAAQCTAGAETQDVSAIEQATAEMTQGDVYLGRTTRVIKSLTGLSCPGPGTRARGRSPGTCPPRFRGSVVVVGR